MRGRDAIVVGAGVSGLAFAWKAACEGRSVLVLEASMRAGGCLHSTRGPDGYWFEMGAHTTYNSYGALLEIVAGTGAREKLTPRGPARTHFGLLRNGTYKWLTPPKVLLELSWLEAAVHFLPGILSSKSDRTVASYYSRLLGRGNYERVLGPFLSAVPSQCADGFPASGAGSLFKRRPRRKEYVRSFGFDGGLQTVCDAASRAPGIELITGARVDRVAQKGDRFSVTTADGRTFEAPITAVAVPPDRAAAMLREDFRELSERIARVRTVSVESMGVVLPREICWMPECAFVVSVGDLFFSCVTRDPFPDARRRAFTFHFRPGTPRDAKVRRMCEVLRAGREQLGEITEQVHVLPAPALGHGGIVDEIDRCLTAGRLAVTGNYFAGLAIEDCVLRSFSEWRRLSPLPR